MTSSSLRAPVTRGDFYEFSRDLFVGIRQLHAEHGPIAALDAASQRVVFLFSPQYNQQVLSDPETYHARFFTIRGPRNSAQRRITGGLLSMNGEQHRRHRRLVKEPFSLRTIATYGPKVTQLADEMLAEWQPGEVVDVADEMRRFMLRVTSTLLFGFDEPDQAYRLGDMLARWIELNHELGAGALMPCDSFTQNYEVLLDFASELEAVILRMIRHRRAESSPARDVLSILIRTYDEQGGMTDEELVGQAAVLFGAAHLTTAHSLTWTLFLLAEHPSIMRQLYGELDQSVAADDSPTASACPVASGNVAGEIDSLLDRVIKESMRVLPASAYSQRINVRAVDIGPLHLPRGTGIVFTPLVTHHLAEVYHDPDRFDPDRWLTIRPSPYEYHPFGAGPRLCLGGPMAMAIMRTTLPRVLSRYRLSLAPGAAINAQVESTMLSPAGGMPMQVDSAGGQFVAQPVVGNIHEVVRLDEMPLAAGEIAPAATSGDGTSPVDPRRPR